MLGHGGIGDEHDGEVRRLDDVEHLPERAVLGAEAGLARRGERRRPLAEADGDLDAGPGERVAEVLGLGRTLRAPADDADLVDAFERLGQQRKQVAAAAHDGFLGPRHLDDLLLEDLRLEVEFLRHLRSFRKKTGPMPVW